MGFISIKNKLLERSKSKKFWLCVGFGFLVLVIFLINTLHESYPDEYDNVLGGWYLLHGSLFYKDWFTHHGPVAYVISAFINLFAFHSFVRFRFIYAVYLFLLTFGSFEFLRRRLKGVDMSFYLYFILLLGLSATYFWGHMLLADNVSAFFLLPVFALVFLKVLNNRILETKDYIFISLFSSFALLSALTYAFLVAGLWIFLGIYYFVCYKRNFNIRQILKIAAIFFAPYLIFLIYLILTGSLFDYFDYAIKFNREFYIYYPGLSGKPPANPIRYAIVIAQGFHNNFSSLLNQVKTFNFDFPFNIALEVSNSALGIYLLIKKKYMAFLFVLGMLIYANARTSPLSSGETDYQSAVYIMFSLFNTAFAIFAIHKELNLNIDYAKKVILSGVFIILLIYSFYNFTFILRKFSYKAYDKYMGFAPLIYDRPKIAPFINQIETKNDYAWIGPFNYEDLYYMNAKVPTTFDAFLPGMGHYPQIQTQMLSEFGKNKPDVMYFNKDYYILGASPKEYGQFFLNFLGQNYVTLGDYVNQGQKYTSNYDPSLILDQRLFINKSKADEIVNKMLERNLIKPI